VGDKRVTRNVGILRPKKGYWDISYTEASKINLLETTEFQDKDEGNIEISSKIDDQIQYIQRNLDKGGREMKENAVGLC